MLESEAQERAESFFDAGKKRVFLGKFLQYEIDLYNDFIIGEVKHVKRYHEVPGQLFRYVIEEKDKTKRLVAYLFSAEIPKEEDIKKIRAVFESFYFYDKKLDIKRNIELYFDWEEKEKIEKKKIKN